MTVTARLKRLAVDAMWHRAHGNTEELRKTLLAIVDDSPEAFFHACSIWALCVETVSAAVVEPARRAGVSLMLGFRIENRDTGESVNPDELPEDMQARVWALRFIAAIGNRDAEQALALYLLADKYDAGIGLGPFELMDMATEAATGSPSWATETRWEH